MATVTLATIVPSASQLKMVPWSTNLETNLWVSAQQATTVRQAPLHPHLARWESTEMQLKEQVWMIAMIAHLANSVTKLDLLRRSSTRETRSAMQATIAREVQRRRTLSPPTPSRRQLVISALSVITAQLSLQLRNLALQAPTRQEQGRTSVRIAPKVSIVGLALALKHQ